MSDTTLRLLAAVRTLAVEPIAPTSDIVRCKLCGSQADTAGCFDDLSHKPECLLAPDDLSTDGGAKQ